MSTTLALYIASLKEFLRDRAALFWTLAFPLLFIVIFGVIFSGSSTASYTVGVVNQDSGPVGAQLVHAFSGKPFKERTGAFDAELDALKKGQRDLVVVIPDGVSQAVAEKRQITIQMYNDPSKNQLDAAIQQQIVGDILTGINQAATGVQPPLTLDSHAVTTHTVRAIDYLTPGILSMALMQLGLFATATPLVSLRQDQVLRRLGATPLPRWQLLASQVLLRLTIGVAQCALILALAVAVFHVQIQGNLLALAGLILLGALTFVAIGYLIASLARTVESASGISSAVNFPMLFLSGIFFPLATLPLWLTPVVRAMPLTYLADAFRQVAIGSTPDFPIAVDVAVLAGWALVCSLLAARLFKWE